VTCVCVLHSYAAFGRLPGDAPHNLELMAELNVVQVPTFLFYRGGKEVGRHVGSSRADLIGRILEIQMEQGIAPPPPQKPGARRRTVAVQ
jgi:hypothetical protein